MQVVDQRKPITTEYPLVSVIMPIYNEANSLPAAIASLGRQNYPHLEILLIDDGSTDNTRQVVDRLTPRLTNYLHYFYQENQGSAVARNRGLSQAKGELIGFLDGDNLWPGMKLKSQVDFLVSNPSVGIVQGYVQCFQNGYAANNQGPIERIGKPFLNSNLGSGLFRKSVFERVGFFNETLNVYEDLDWFLRAQALGLTKKVLTEVMLLCPSHNEGLTAGRSLPADTGRLRQILKQNLELS